MGKDAQFSRDSQPQVRSSSKMIIFIASLKIGRFLARLFPAAEGFRATPPHNAEVRFSRSASPRCSVCVWTHCRCERCRATRSNALDSCSPPSFRSITKSKKKKKANSFYSVFFFLLLSPLSINAHCKNPFFSSCTMGNWIEFRAGINVFAPSLPSSPLPPSLNFIFFPLLDYSAVVSSQATSDFCVSPDKFIVNQTKDVLTAGVSIYQPHFSSSPPSIMLISLPVFLVSPLRCRALLPVLQPQSTQPLSTGNDGKKRERKKYLPNTSARRETHNGKRVVLENEFSLVGYRAAGTLSGPLIGSSHNSIAPADKP